MFGKVGTPRARGRWSERLFCLYHLAKLVHDNKYYLIHALRGRFDYPTLKALAISHAAMHKPGTILIEDAGVGTALVKELQEAGLSAIAVKPEHNKLTRMSVQSNKFANGQVFFRTRLLRG
jgi:predicted phage terminase large subunit-like protein